MGSVYVYAQELTKIEFPYPGFNKFNDKGGKALKENLIYYIEPDAVVHSPLVQTYYLVVDQTKVRFNLAVCLGVWLMLTRISTNTESRVSYNNKLKQVAAEMKLTNDMNPGTKKAGW